MEIMSSNIMNRRIDPCIIYFFMILAFMSCQQNTGRHTYVSIEGEKFLINGNPTLRGVV